MPNELTMLTDVSLADRAEEMIRSAILNGEMKPNQRFTIEDVAGRLGISRTPVREALKALQVDGLVRLLPHRGAMVETYAHGEIRNRYLIKALLEGFAAELAAQGDPQGLAARLEANCDALDRLCGALDPDAPADSDVLALTRINAEFHDMIRQASGSKTLIRLLSSLRQPTAYTITYWKNPQARAASQLIHRRIAEAFRRGDPAAARALAEQHLTDAADRMMQHFDEIDGDAGEEARPTGTDS